MLSYAVRRLLEAIPTLLVIVALAFFLMHAAPGGPFDGERVLPPEIEANLKAAYNLDKPIWQQFLIYLGNALQGDFGPSFTYKDFTVSELIGTGFPVSLRLGLSAIFLAVAIGCTLGVLAAMRQNSRTDYAVMGVAMAGITIPNFVMAPLLTLVFGIYLGWLPVAGWGDGSIQNMVLPVIALALPQIAIISRLTRGGMIEVLRSNFVRTAHAKGLPERLIIWRHTLRAALLPVVSYLGPAIAGLVTGSVVIEQIFQLPGIGRYFVQGAINRDYTLVMGTVITYGSLIVLMNLIVDLVYGLLDPRVRYD
ncbi:oligopeptide ABC transporter permease OppB [Rhodospirillum centenum]|uniref:Oligopeptide transport system permease protein OppB n=1 Tax=Rhodospirillum centenum (strain ATCC 51521 / SW) TaxID=414684 RepID=B6IWQ0_RHOCS|nr:oligopeptide ABC transporter permease OppB [Rhodospirillum centenum]ACJ00724.1 oligopeptide transport system permease protein OppB [Rhodospirillum centenum SW]